MRTQPSVKSLSVFIAVALVALVLGCNRKASVGQSAEEALVLEQSSFYPGEKTPEIQTSPEAARLAVNKDGGTIAGPGSSGGNDGGSIPAPGAGGTGGSSGGAAAGGGAASGGAAAGGSAGGAASGGSAAGGSSSVGGGSAAGGGSAGGSASNGTQPGGSDGGAISGPTAPNGGDGGGIIAGNGGSGSGGSNAGGSNSNSGGAGAGGSAGGAASGGSAAGGSSSAGGGSAANGGQPGGADNGAVMPGGNSGGSNDGGSVAGGGNSNGTDQGGMAQNGGNGSTGGSSTTPGNSDGTGNASGATDQANNGGNSSGGSSGPSGNDGGTIPSGNGNSGTDGGSVAGGGNSNGTDQGGMAQNGGGNQGGSNPGTNPGNSSGGSATPGGSSSGNQANNGSGTPGGSNQPGGTDGGAVNPGSGSNPGGDGGSKPVTPPSNHADSGKTIVDIIKDIIKKIEDIAKNNPPANGGNPAASPTPAPGGSGNIADNKNPQDGGQKPTDPNVKPGDGGKTPGGSCTPHNPNQIQIDIARVCSARRSQIPYPQFVFFEEAKHPILAVEAIVNNGGACYSKPQPQYASTGYGSNGYGGMQKSELLSWAVHSVDLSQWNIFEERFSAKLDSKVREIKNQFPRNWRNVLVTTRVCDDTNLNGKCSDEVAANTLSVSNPAFTLDHIPSTMKLDVWAARYMTLASDPDICEKQYSPLLLDLAGTGFTLTPAEKGVYFDLNDTGTEVATGWTAPSTLQAFLVRDVNGNGRIDSGAELFGSATRLPDGNRASNGFEALRPFDNNGDGVVDSADSGYRQLRLWIDRNANARSDRGEIFTLEKMGVQSINLSYVTTQEVDPHGNQTRQRSTFRMKTRDGKTVVRMVIDVWFNTLVSFSGGLASK